MAIIAVIATGYVSLVLTRCRDTVVTGPAAAQHLRVINDGHRYECDRRMTIFADVRRAHVGRTLANCIGAVVA